MCWCICVCTCFCVFLFALCICVCIVYMCSHCVYVLALCICVCVVTHTHTNGHAHTGTQTHTPPLPQSTFSTIPHINAARKQTQQVGTLIHAQNLTLFIKPYWRPRKPKRLLSSELQACQLCRQFQSENVYSNLISHRCVYVCVFAHVCACLYACVCVATHVCVCTCVRIFVFV